jgi:prepilin peptidase CpaA
MNRIYRERYMMPFFTDVSLASHAVAGLLIVAILAAWHDWFQWRIPNRLLAASCAAALMLAAFATGSPGIAYALAGGLLGFVLIWPFYWMGGMAAGDVKLMATLGLFAGPAAVIDIALISFFIGGVWSVILLLNRTTTGALVYARIRSMPWHLLNFPQRDPIPRTYVTSRGVIPYGVVIAIGVIVSIVLGQLH